MIEIGIPNFIATKEYNNDPLKYGYLNTYKRGDYTLLVNHDGEFFSLLDIATTLKRFKIRSLFMIISKTQEKDEYTILIGNSFYPYEKTLLHKSVITSGDEFQTQVNKTRQFIEMVKTLLNSAKIIVFPVGVDDKEIDILLQDSIEYSTADITKYLYLTPTVEPINKKIIPFVASLLIGGVFYYFSNYIDDYFKYDVKSELKRELSKSKKQLYAKMDVFREVDKKNKELKKLLADKNSVKIYHGDSHER